MVGNSGTALFSECGTYRYLLTRKVRSEITVVKRCLFIMLNPSTADAESDDPTLKRCMGFSQRWGMTYLHVVNLFAMRATDPKRLFSAGDPVGPENDGVITTEVTNADLIIAAWGNYGAFNGRAEDVRTIISRHGIGLHHLGLNLTGQPRHPLYAPSDAVLSPATF